MGMKRFLPGDFHPSASDLNRYARTIHSGNRATVDYSLDLNQEGSPNYNVSANWLAGFSFGSENPAILSGSVTRLGYTYYRLRVDAQNPSGCGNPIAPYWLTEAMPNWAGTTVTKGRLFCRFLGVNRFYSSIPMTLRVSWSGSITTHERDNFRLFYLYDGDDVEETILDTAWNELTGCPATNRAIPDTVNPRKDTPYTFYESPVLLNVPANKKPVLVVSVATSTTSAGYWDTQYVEIEVESLGPWTGDNTQIKR